MASPWKANSSTSVTSKAAIDQGPILSIAAANAACPLRSSAVRHNWARITGMTMYNTTEVNSVLHGTVIDEMPSNRPTMGAKAKIMIVSLSATCVSVK